LNLFWIPSFGESKVKIQIQGFKLDLKLKKKSLKKGEFLREWKVK